MPPVTHAIGIDIGGVIIGRVNDNTDTSFFSDNYLKTTPTPGCFEAIAQIVEAFEPVNTYLVSKTGPRHQVKTLEWLRDHQFYEKTGFLPDNAVFCRKRKEKAGIAEALGLDHFIDDRLEILGYLTSVKYKFLLFPQIKEVEDFREHSRYVKTCHSWDEILALMEIEVSSHTIPDADIPRIRSLNNPLGLATGHYTGRCARCHSLNLWDDMAVYGCHCCGAVYSAGHLPPKVISNG